MLKTNPMTMRLPVDMKRELDALAAATERTRSSVVREAIVAYRLRQRIADTKKPTSAGAQNPEQAPTV